MKCVKHDFYHNFVNTSQSNLILTKKILIDEVSKLLLLHPNIIIEILKDENISLPENATQDQLTQILGNNLYRRNIRNKIAKLILLTNSRDEEGKFLNFKKTFGDFNSAEGKGLGKFLKNLFGKGKKFYAENKDEIDNISYGLGETFGGTSSKGTNSSASQTLQNNTKNLQNWQSDKPLYTPQAGGMSTNKILFILFGSAIGIALLFITFKKLKK